MDLSLSDICAVLGCSKAAASRLRAGKYERPGSELIQRYQALEAVVKRAETGKEKDVKFKVLSVTGAGDKQVTKVVHVVDVSVKDLDTPRYKLYFQNDHHMRQWESRLTAWLDMRAAQS